MTTTAIPTEDGSAYILNGSKLWITNGSVAELMVVMARTPGKDGKPGPISAFIVEVNSPGFEIVERPSFMGLRGIENATPQVHERARAKENLLWGEGRVQARAHHAQHRPPHASRHDGRARQVVPRRLPSLGERAPAVGKNVGKHDAIAQMLAKMAADTHAMEAVGDLGCLLADRGKSDIRSRPRRVSRNTDLA